MDCITQYKGDKISMEGCLGKITMSWWVRIICFYKQAQHNSFLHYFQKAQISLMAQQPKPSSPIIALELPQPEGPTRQTRINLLLTLDAQQLCLFSFQAITHLLHETTEYNDARLKRLALQLKKQKKVREMSVLTMKEMLTFTESQIQQTQAIIQELHDQRLTRQKAAIDYVSYKNEKIKNEKIPQKTFKQTFFEMFSFSANNNGLPKKEEQEQLQQSYEPQRKVGVHQFNFKYD